MAADPLTRLIDRLGHHIDARLANAEEWLDGVFPLGSAQPGKVSVSQG